MAWSFGRRWEYWVHLRSLKVGSCSANSNFSHRCKVDSYLLSSLLTRGLLGWNTQKCVFGTREFTALRVLPNWVWGREGVWKWVGRGKWTRKQKGKEVFTPKNNSWRLILTRVKFSIVDSPCVQKESSTGTFEGFGIGVVKTLNWYVFTVRWFLQWGNHKRNFQYETSDDISSMTNSTMPANCMLWAAVREAFAPRLLSNLSISGFGMLWYSLASTKTLWNVVAWNHDCK